MPPAPVDTRELVMIVDDSVTMRRVAERLLTRNGYRVLGGTMLALLPLALLLAIARGMKPREMVQAIISVGRTSAPLLILAGENDTTIGNQTPRRLAEIIQAAGGRCELKMYPNAGHGFDRAGDTGAGNTAAATDAKQRTLAFLRR